MSPKTRPRNSVTKATTRFAGVAKQFAPQFADDGVGLLCGEEFAAMEEGISYAEVQAAVDKSVNIVSDPPRVLDMDLAKRHVAALDELPRPTLVTCRTGPRSSAVVYLYAGLKAGASVGEILAQAESDSAPFCSSADLKAWVTQGLEELS